MLEVYLVDMSTYYIGFAYIYIYWIRGPDSSFILRTTYGKPTS